MKTVDEIQNVGHCEPMQTKHIIHVTLNGKNLRVEANTFEAAIEALNLVTKNQLFNIETLEHIVSLGE